MSTMTLEETDGWMDAPDLERDAGAGYIVRAYFLPDLAAPTGATITVWHGNKRIGTLSCAPADAITAWRHTAAILEPYRDALTASETDGAT